MKPAFHNSTGGFQLFGGRRWGDGDFYKVLEAAITIHGTGGDETLGRWIDEVQ